ncbi:thiamine phosphate synthase [Kurthia massiliensis]|uniref:thiamine phosphate synthase n=1 Tax=Kurthia massiliensis TaxID=1033739 RepID=UPI000288B759|nr:thiamine phosphate synthase [Kurthia massiliensis]
MNNFLHMYFIMGSMNASDPIGTLEKALQHGVTCFQLREKGPNALRGTAYVQFARQCQALCQQYGVPFIVNDDVALALQLDADGVHVGQDDLSVNAVAALFPQKIIGVSVHNRMQLEEAIQRGASYVGIGPIYETTSKLDAQAPSGLTFLREAKKAYPSYPIVAIGGIHERNAHRVRQAGADGISVISAICKSDNIARTIQKLSADH